MNRMGPRRMTTVGYSKCVMYELPANKCLESDDTSQAVCHLVLLSGSITMHCWQVRHAMNATGQPMGKR